MRVINLESKQEYDITVNKSGENAMICPMCSETRNKKKDKCFYFNYDKKAGRCNHCGGVLVEKREYTEPVKYKRPPFVRERVKLSDKVVDWFKDRKISIPTLIHFKVAEGKEFMPQRNQSVNTIQFNYFKHGELINIKFRDALKNFKMVSNAELIPFNIDSIINTKQIIWVEGEPDCLALYECNVTNVISVPNGATIGKNNLTYLDNIIDLIPEDAEHILAFDNDAAGNSLVAEFVRRLGAENCNRVTFKDCKDANECLIKYDPETVRGCIADKKEFPVSGIFSSYDLNAEIDDYYHNGLPEGCGIGIEQHDELIKFHPGYMTVVTGIPGHGKSEYVDFLTTKLNILHKWPIGIYSPENYPLQLHFSKFAEKLIGKSFSYMNPMELAMAKKYFSENFFFIKPEEDNKLDSILDKAKYLVRKKGIRALVIDAWNKVEHQWDGSETQYISRELDRIVLSGEKQGYHTFLVAHPTKISKDKNTGLHELPNLYSINGSANFFNKTHNGVTVYRNFTTGRTEVYWQKIKFKHWGKVGNIELEWDWKNGRYYVLRPDNTNCITGQQNNVQTNINHIIEPVKDEASIPTGEEEAPF